MPTIRKFCLLIMAFSLLSCQDTGTARFIVKNKSSSLIDSLFFRPSDTISRQYIKLEPGEEQKYNLPMTGLRTDGAYSINFRKRLEKISQVFGYFSNGMSMEKYTEIEIMEDTILFTPEY